MGQPKLNIFRVLDNYSALVTIQAALALYVVSVDL